MNCKGFIKYGVLFWVCTLFAVVGLLLVAVGIVAELRLHHDDPNFVKFNFLSAPPIIIFIGVIIFVMAFVGCCGSIKENICMIKAFMYFLLLLLILEIAAVVAVYAKRGEIESELKSQMNHTMPNYDTNKDIAKSWNILQHEFTCCGLDGPLDWTRIGSKIPPSCCDELLFNEATMVAAECSEQNAYHEGCFEIVKDSLISASVIIGLSLIVVSLIQMLMIGFSYALIRSIRNNYTTV